MRPAACLLALLCLATPAYAGTSVGVVVTGDQTIQPQVTAQLEAWLRQRGHTLATTALPADAIHTIIDCFVVEDLPCAKAVVDTRASATSIVFVKVDVTTVDGGREIEITAHWLERDMESVAVRRSCLDCTDDRLAATADELMTALAGNQPVAPVATVVPPVAPAAPGPSPSRTVPLVVLGVGAALITGGVIAIAIDEDDTGEQPEYRNTMPLGVTLGVVGLAAVGAGAYLWWRGNKAEAHPHVAIVPGGAYIGWGRSF